MAYKEIVTKAIVGKAKKYFKNKYSITPEVKPTTVLGCWVINHQFKGYKTGENIVVDGAYDVNIWYSYENDSKTTVVNKKITYNDLFNVATNDNIELTSDTDIIVRSLKQPSCTNVSINEDGNIEFEIEKELGIEVVGESKMKIAIEDNEEPWQDLNEEVKEDEIDEINEDYLE